MRRANSTWARVARGIVVCAACVGCAAGGKVGYAIAPDVPPENRALLIERFEKGKVLFKTNCATCHGIYTAGQEGAPNFSTEQIDNYNANHIKGDQKNHMVARKLSQQQVDYILTFLRLRTMPSK